jgi:hypothetical protein
LFKSNTLSFGRSLFLFFSDSFFFSLLSGKLFCS